MSSLAMYLFFLFVFFFKSKLGLVFVPGPIQTECFILNKCFFASKMLKFHDFDFHKLFKDLEIAFSFSQTIPRFS